MVVNWAVSEIDVSDAGFWDLPPQPRDAAFRVLRRERPVAFFAEPARMPDPDVAGDPQWLRSSAINGIKHLPVRFTPSQRGG